MLIQRIAAGAERNSRNRLTGVWLCCCCAILTATAWGQPPNRPQRPPRDRAGFQQRLPRVPDGVKLLTDVAYREGHSAWKLDLAMPEVRGEEPRPAIVFVHGGGWRGGDKRQGYFLQGALDYAQQGYVCVSVNYRLTGDAPLPACIEDVKCAVRWLRAHAEQYHIDPQRIGAYGNSAGAHLVCLLGLAGPQANLEGDGPHQDQSSLVQAVCASAAPTDFLNWRGAGRAMDGRKLFAGPADLLPEQRKQASPITYVSADAPPVLLIHGTDDRVVPFLQGESLAQALQSAGAKDAALLTFEGAGHGVFMQNADETHAAMAKFFDRVLRSRGDRSAQTDSPPNDDSAPPAGAAPNDEKNAGSGRPAFDGTGPRRGGGGAVDWLRRLDRNGDGQVSKEEFPGPPIAFARRDANGDGVIDRDEFRSPMGRRGAAGQRGAPDRGRDSRREAMEKRLQSQGVQVGEAAPDAVVYTLDGREFSLATLWASKPTVLVTASITCPIAVDTCPSLKLLREQHDARVNFAVLYVREAHPREEQERQQAADSDAEASGFGSHFQPRTQAERQELARLFHREFVDPAPVYVADVDNQLARSLGTGPNSALLIDADGKLVAKQGWYSADKMQQEIDKLLGAAKRAE